MIRTFLRGFVLGIGFCAARAVWRWAARIVAAGGLWWVVTESAWRLT